MYRGNAQRTGQSPVDTSLVPGLLQWQNTSASFNPGLVTSPSTTNQPQALYVGDADGNLYAFNPDGTLHWKTSLTPGFFVEARAVAADGTVYVMSGGAVYAVASNGAPKWSFPVCGGNFLENGLVVAPRGTIYAADCGGLYALSPEGKLTWKLTISNSCDEISQPTLGLDGTIYVEILSPSSFLIAVSPSGNLLWKSSTLNNGEGVEYPNWPVIGPSGAIYLANAGTLYALNSAGSLRWTLAGVGSGGPAIDPKGVIYATTGGSISAIDPNGAIIWTSPNLGGDGLSYPTIGGDGTIYTGVAITTQNAPGGSRRSFPGRPHHQVVLSDLFLARRFRTRYCIRRRHLHK